MKIVFRYFLAVFLCGCISFSSIVNVRAGESAGVGHVEFRVGSIQTKRVGGARIIVINPEGKIIASGLTNQSGVWKTSLPYQSDARYEQVSPRGIVTAIVVANGYNEQAVFEVPVTSDSVQPIVLNPIAPERRNEPTASLGYIHHHDLANFINKYATKFGLNRQNPIHGEQSYAPWGPDLTNPNKSVPKGASQ